MSEPLTMWRIELLHPSLVHFPIGLLVVGAALRAISGHFVRSHGDRPAADFVYGCARLMNALGVVAAWAAYVSGELAEDEVNSVLCDPTMTHFHSELALYSSLIFTFVLLGDLLAWIRSQAWSQSYLAHFMDPLSRHLVFLKTETRIYRGFFALVAILGAALLAYTGHAGASLVYQQGAAVYFPSPDCHEFEE